VSIELTDLRVDGRTAPLAAARDGVRFSWRLHADEHDVAQTGYRLVVSHAGGSIVWDTGAVEATWTTATNYSGPPLPAESAFVWALTVHLNTGATTEAHGTFETEPSPLAWEEADWIGRQRPASTPHDHHPAPYLRGAMTVRAGVTRARVYATAGGLFDLWCNGTRVSLGDLAPGWTDYRYRVPFHGYDLTPLLSSGTNVLGAILGEGWYCGYVGPFGKRGVWGEAPVFRAIVLIEYADGSRDRFTTGPQWESATGPVLSAELLHGFRFDNRLSLGEWSTTIGGWDAAVVASGPTGALVSARIDPATPVREIAAVSITQSTSGSPVIDFGQNIAGRVRLRVRARAGSIVRLRHSEILTPEGDLYIDNLRGAAATDEFIAAGVGEETFDPIFTYHGFRYVEVTGAPDDLMLDDATALLVSSLSETTLNFDTDSDVLNAIQRNLEWTMMSNFIEVPTDCPNRDERLGWAGDAQMFAPSAMYNADVETFFRKWLDDIADAQKPNGAFADIAPGALVDFAEEGAAGYADAGVFLPWDLFQHFGDASHLQRNYAGASRWLDYIRSENPDMVWRHRRNADYGDWLATEATDKSLTATAYWAHAARITAAYAATIGRIAESEAHRALAERIASAFRAEFLDDGGKLRDATQTALAVALAFDLLVDEQIDLARAQLIEDVERRGHLTTGFLGIRWVYPTLIAAGRPDLVVLTALRTERPSLGHQLSRGMTTIGEHWSAWDEEDRLIDPSMNSFNHFALASGFDSIYRCIGGVTALAPGFSVMRISPYTGGEIQRSRLEFDAPPGRVLCAWEREGDELSLDVRVPANASAVIDIPGESVKELSSALENRPGIHIVESDAEGMRVSVGSGTYRFRFGGVR